MLGSAGRKLESMEGGLREVGEEIAGLDARRNALLAQLAQLEAQLAQAHARRADLEESRNVFEEGVAFSLDALQHQVRHKLPPSVPDLHDILPTKRRCQRRAFAI